MNRKPKKICPVVFLATLCAEAFSGSPSYNDLAAGIEAASGLAPSRQSIAERMGPACLRFLQALLEHVMGLKGAAVRDAHPGPAGRYQRVLVQDSTVIQLPAALFGAFSGVSNASSTSCNARIQAVYDLASMRFTAFAIDPYSTNDRKAAPALEIRRGDLVLRDRGYLTNGELARHVAAGADCIYRHCTGTIYLDPSTGRDRGGTGRCGDSRHPAHAGEKGDERSCPVRRSSGADGLDDFHHHDSRGGRLI
jgi:hypothetical protein